MKQSWNAYANERLAVEPLAEGSLSGRTFAVKDVFDIAGHTPGAGNPDWLRTHGPSAHHAAVIDRLLRNGARLEGTTITDELMYSINGENAHYGTPMNPKAPGRIPGGSSSGSAVAVSAGLTDFAIGTDTGGSIRVPSAYCGIYGIRPTHGAVDASGLIPLAPSFDTVGWMAKGGQTLLDVGRVLLGPQESGGAVFPRMMFAQDLWTLTDGHSSAAASRYFQALRELAKSHEDVIVAPNGLQEWMDAFRIIQGLEIWRVHQEWITREQPSFGPGIAERFAWASTLKWEESGAAYRVREEARNTMNELLGNDAVLVVPTVPAIAPLLHLTGPEIEQRRVQTLKMSCVAGLAGLPQVTVPITGELGCPIGISFIAGQGQDLRLLEWVANSVEARMKLLSD
ncbi:amidase [Paenibacillus sp. Soil522]|uniref:amidase n=1 Tax=Paenibacillus sp. Soil522 TaxID=1736388 RepID=UPI0006F821A6|nr:amidase [Paenibacillus sp. Soil522]KRE53664.1 amidase [Paenibacillus sp. Soil522]